jgi:hypothetical protein
MSGRPSTPTAAPSAGEPRNSRVHRLRASHSFGFVLALVLASFLFALLASDGSWSGSTLVLLQAAVLVLALWTSGTAGLRSVHSRALLAAAAVTAVLNVIPGGALTHGAVSLITALLTVASIVVIGRGVVDQGEVNLQSVRGAIAIYVLLGMLFVGFYGAIVYFDSDPFFAQGTDGTRALRTYFSFVTLATLGYGDYTPADTAGHALAVVEALLGQIYLVTVVAVIVARLGHRGDAHPGGVMPHVLGRNKLETTEGRPEEERAWQ